MSAPLVGARKFTARDDFGTVRSLAARRLEQETGIIAPADPYHLSPAHKRIDRIPTDRLMSSQDIRDALKSLSSQYDPRTVNNVTRHLHALGKI